MVTWLGLLASVLAASAVWVSPAYAATETYTISGTGSGSLDGTAFTNSAFTFTLVGDPATLQNLGLTTVVDPLISATATINGFGPVTFGLPTRLGQNGVEIFFSRSGGGGLDLFDFMLGSQVNLASSFGPVTGTNVSAFNQFVDVATSGGNLTFTQSSSVQFSGVLGGAAPVPEPATWAMMLLGFVGTGITLRCRRQPSLAEAA